MESRDPQDRHDARALAKEQRRRVIRSLVESQSQGNVADLARRFGVSEVTIRSDLAALANVGALVRVHGGALPPGDGEELPLTVKQTLYHAEKVRIATAAAGLIQDGETLILDSGTTTAEIARQIRGLKLRSLNVITNALNVAVILANAHHVNLIIPGGVLRRKSWSLAGPQAEQALSELQADRLYLGVDSLDPAIGLMTIAVTDSSKLLRRNLSVIAPVEQVHMLITDSGAAPEAVAAIRARGVEVRLV
jgi:DeoR family transcriptional regulator of aga operon